MGGQDAWNAAHCVRFDFKVSIGGETKADRSHLWDKQTGRYRFEEKNQVVLMNLADKQGTAYLDGKKMEGPGAAKAIDGAYKAYVNDFYWLAMPWKWMDAGVNLKYIGKKPQGGEDCEVVELSFEKVGLTPGDRWCVTAVNWARAYDDGVAAPVVLAATNEAVLQIVPIDVLRGLAVDVPPDASSLDAPA